MDEIYRKSFLQRHVLRDYVNKNFIIIHDPSLSVQNTNQWTDLYLASSVYSGTIPGKHKNTTLHGNFGYFVRKKGKLQNQFECQRTKRESHLKFRLAIGPRLVTWSERPLPIGSTAHQNRISARLHFVFHCAKEGIRRTNSESRTENSISGGKLRRSSVSRPISLIWSPGREYLIGRSSSRVSCCWRIEGASALDSIMVPFKTHTDRNICNDPSVLTSSGDGRRQKTRTRSSSRRCVLSRWKSMREMSWQNHFRKGSQWSSFQRECARKEIQISSSYKKIYQNWDIWVSSGPRLSYWSLLNPWYPAVIPRGPL